MWLKCKGKIVEVNFKVDSDTLKYILLDKADFKVVRVSAKLTVLDNCKQNSDAI